jgi:hypothetical protein
MDFQNITQVVVFTFILASTSAQAQEETLGLGLIVGTPTGVSAEYRLSTGQSVDAGLGFGYRGAHIHMDYLFHTAPLSERENFRTPLYFGVGGRLLSHDRGRKSDDTHLHLGPRFPVGLSLDFAKSSTPLEIFLEVAVLPDIVLGNENQGHEGFSLDVDLGLGVRWYF